MSISIVFIIAVFLSGLVYSLCSIQFDDMILQWLLDTCLVLHLHLLEPTSKRTLDVDVWRSLDLRSHVSDITMRERVERVQEDQVTQPVLVAIGFHGAGSFSNTSLTLHYLSRNLVGVVVLEGSWYEGCVILR